MGVGIRRLDGRQHDRQPGALHHAAESLRPLAVSIADQDPVAHQEPIDRIGQSTRRLRHERRIRSGAGTTTSVVLSVVLGGPVAMRLSG